MSDGADMRATAPLVSVVVINHNYGRYLGCCLESVLDQTYSNIQCIVVDNASTDKSSLVIENFRERFALDRAGIVFDTIMSDENMHLTKSMIAGFAIVKGPYVIFLDADDYLLPTCIETHIRAHLMLRVPVGLSSIDMYQSQNNNLVNSTGPGFANYVMSKRGQQSIFARMDKLESFNLSRGPEDCHLEASDLHFVERHTTSEWVWSPTSGLCFRSDAVSLMFSYLPKIRANTDSYLIRGIASLTGSVTIDRPLAVYRIHGGNIFTKHPSLANFRSYDIKSHNGDQEDVITEIMACYIANAPSLAQRLLWSGLYIEAVDIVSKVYPGIKPRTLAVSSFTLEFIIKNRDILICAFGKSTYISWIWRFSKRPRDFVAMLRVLFRIHFLKNSLPKKEMTKVNDASCSKL